jgi:hypothetical membrane protein
MDLAQETKTVSLFAICGVIAPLLFAILVITAASLRTGYSHVSQFISELGYGSNAVVQNADFVLTGLLVILFSYGLHKGVGGGLGSRVGPAFVAAFGVGLIGAGVFPGDPASPTIQMSHVLFASVAEIAGAAVPLVMCRRLAKDPSWRGYATLSLLTGIVGLVLLIVFYVGVFGSGILDPWKGAVQRLFWAVPFLWIEFAAVKLLK